MPPAGRKFRLSMPELFETAHFLVSRLWKKAPQRSIELLKSEKQNIAEWGYGTDDSDGSMHNLHFLSRGVHA